MLDRLCLQPIFFKQTRTRKLAYLDVAQEMMQSILWLSLAPVSTQTPVSNCYILYRPVFYRETAQQNKASAIDCFVSKLNQLWAKLWKHEVRLLDILYRTMSLSTKPAKLLTAAYSQNMSGAVHLTTSRPDQK
jgi:hypothetical protein